MLGLPEVDRDQFQAWSDALLELTKLEDPEKIEKAANANQELLAYLAEIIETKRLQPAEDFIAQMIAAEAEGTAQEMYSTCVLLLSAGHETTTRLIGNGLYLFVKTSAANGTTERGSCAHG
jgi:cytochrome P450